MRLIPDQAFDITTDVSALTSDAVILGRYGPAWPLEQPEDSCCTKKKLAIIQATSNLAAVGGYVDLTIVPQFENNGCLEPADLADTRFGTPILFLNGVPVPEPYQYPPLSGADKAAFQMEAEAECLAVFGGVPEAMFPKLSGAVLLKFPFRHGFSASQVVYDPNSIYKLQILRSGVDYVLQKANGPFVPPGAEHISTRNWRLLVADDPPLEMSATCPNSPPRNSNVFCPLTPNDNLARISIGKSYSCSDTENSPKPKVVPPVAQGRKPKQAPKTVSSNQPEAKAKSCLPKIVLLQQAYWDTGKQMLLWQGTYSLSVPKDDSDSQKPSLDKDQSGSVTQHDAVWVSFSGTALSGVGAVTVSGTELDINAAKDGKSIAVLVPKWVTKDAATIDLTFMDKQGSQIGTARLTVKANPSGANK